MTGNDDLAVNFARGDRDYVTSVDMMYAAPVNPEDDGFKFRFFDIVRSPGHWVAAQDLADREHAKAEVRIERGEATENHFFVCPDENAPLARAEDYAFEFDTGRYAVRDQFLKGSMQGDAGFWEQLIEAIRYAGAVVYPGMSWYVVGITGCPQCLAPVAEGTELSLDIRRAFGKRNMVPYTTGSGAQGRIVTLRKD